MAQTTKSTHDQRRQQQLHSTDGLSDFPVRKISQQVQSPERTRRIGQYSKEAIDTRHSQHNNNQEKDEKFRRISQYSKASDGGDMGSDRQRKISQYSQDGRHLKDPTMWGYGRSRFGTRRENERFSVVTSGGMERPVVLENTYKLEPDAKFNPSKVKAIIKDVLQEHLGGLSYEKTIMAHRCVALCDVLKEKVRQIKLDRFKIVTVVMIVEKKDQALMVASRCLWDHGHDNFASCEYTNGNLCAVGMVFAVYQE